MGIAACEEAPSRPAPPETDPTWAPRHEASEPSAIGRTPETHTERVAARRAEEAAHQLGRTLKRRLLAAMTEGPEAAARACAADAQGLTRQVAEAQQARVGRSSLRLRNPDNRGPTWVTEWLEAQGERPAEGVAKQVGIAAGDPPIARFVGPIALEGPCVLCHGETGALSEPVRAVLAAHYPEDRATGYAVGDLRGAMWAEMPIENTD